MKKKSMSYVGALFVIAMCSIREVVIRFAVLTTAITALMLASAVPANAQCGANVSISGNTAEITPSGGADSAGVQCVFDLFANQQGSVVHFKSGRINLTTLLDIHDFDGEISGEGADNSIIGNMPGLPPWPVFADQGDPQLGLIIIRQDDNLPRRIDWSDLTLTFVGRGEPVFVFGAPDDRRALVGIVGKLGRIETDPPTPLSTSWTDMKFIGERTGVGVSAGNVFALGFGGETVFHEVAPVDGLRAFRITGYRAVAGDHYVRSSLFRDVASGIQTQALANGKMVIGGNATRGNVFDNVSSAALVTHELDAHDVEFSFNSVQNPFLAGIIALQAAVSVRGFDEGGFGPLPVPSVLVVEHNDFHLAEPASGVVVTNFGHVIGRRDFLKTIHANNNFDMGGTSFHGFIDIGTDGSVFKNNVFHGSPAGAGGGHALIELSLDTHCAVLGNSVSSVETDFVSVLLILTEDCVVVGGNNKTNLAELDTVGTVATGVNVMGNGAELGGAVSAAAQHKQEVLQTLAIMPNVPEHP